MLFFPSHVEENTERLVVWSSLPQSHLGVYSMSFRIKYGEENNIVPRGGFILGDKRHSCRISASYFTVVWPKPIVVLCYPSSSTITVKSTCSETETSEAGPKLISLTVRL